MRLRHEKTCTRAVLGYGARLIQVANRAVSDRKVLMREERKMTVRVSLVNSKCTLNF